MPTYSGLQSIRNAEAFSLALDLPGLGPISGSAFDCAQDLAVTGRRHDHNHDENDHAGSHHADWHVTNGNPGPNWVIDATEMGRILCYWRDVDATCGWVGRTQSIQMGMREGIRRNLDE